MLSLLPAYQALFRERFVDLPAGPASGGRQASSHSASVGRGCSYEWRPPASGKHLRERKLTLITGSRCDPSPGPAECSSCSAGQRVGRHLRLPVRRGRRRPARRKHVERFPWASPSAPSRTARRSPSASRSSPCRPDRTICTFTTKPASGFDERARVSHRAPPGRRRGDIMEG